MCAIVHVWRSEATGKVLFFFHCVGPRDRTQAVRVGSRCLHPQAEVVWYLSSVSPPYFPLQWDSFSVVGIFIVVGLSLFLEHVATHCFTQKYHGYLSVLYWLGLICVDTRLSRCPSRLLHCTLPILLSVLKASTFLLYTLLFWGYPIFLAIHLVNSPDK